MNTDKSKILYNKLDEVQNKKVKLQLINNEIKSGFLIGFFHGENEFIERWIFQEAEELIFNPEEGEIIKQKDISEVFFFDDNSQIIF
jgi:hypothetical protein